MFAQFNLERQTITLIKVDIGKYAPISATMQVLDSFYLSASILINLDMNNSVYISISIISISVLIYHPLSHTNSSIYLLFTFDYSY